MAAKKLLALSLFWGEDDGRHTQKAAVAASTTSPSTTVQQVVTILSSPCQLYGLN